MNLLSPGQRKIERNNHLLPNIVTRAKKILNQVKQEELNAFSVHSIPVAYYKVATGKRCLCSGKNKEVVDSEPLTINDLLNKIPSIYSAKESCPICFNTGIINGYRRLGTIQILLDSSNFDSKNNMIVINDDEPSYIVSKNADNCFISWKFKIPKNYIEILHFAIKWKNEPLSWDISIENQPVSNQIIFDNKNRDVTLTLTINKASSNFGIYAIFISFAVSNLFLINSDFPKLGGSLTADFHLTNEISSPQTIFIPSIVGDIDTSDLFIDSKYNKIWRIVSFEKNNPYGIVFGYSCECRLVKEFESNFLIPDKLIINSYPNNYTYFL